MRVLELFTSIRSLNLANTSGFVNFEPPFFKLVSPIVEGGRLECFGLRLPLTGLGRESFWQNTSNSGLEGKKGCISGKKERHPVVRVVQNPSSI
jgi:hypothetical protein